MTEVWRQRRLSVQNRLEELRARHGTDLEDQELPAWLDHLPTPQERQERRQVTSEPFRGTLPIVPSADKPVFGDLSV